MRAVKHFRTLQDFEQMLMENVVSIIVQAARGIDQGRRQRSTLDRLETLPLDAVVNRDPEMESMPK